ILNCNIHNNGNPASSSTQGQDGVYSDETTSGNIYRANFVHHNGRTGSNLDHGLYICGKNELVINNVLLANAAHGIQVAGYTTVPNPKVNNKVMAMNGGTASSSGSLSTELISRTTSSIKMAMLVSAPGMPMAAASTSITTSPLVTV